MKLNKILLTIAALGVATSVFGQGLFMSNLGNTGGSAATSSGLVYIQNGSVSLADLYNNDVGVEISAGLTTDSLSPLGLGTYTSATDPKGYTAWGLGQFYLGNVAIETTIPGASAGGTAWIQMNMWFDGPYGVPTMYNSYSQAYGVGYTGTVLFQQLLSGGGSPPAPPTGFTSMPSVVLSVVPEPSTFVLAGLGMGAIWLLRRRK